MAATVNPRSTCTIKKESSVIYICPHNISSILWKVFCQIMYNMTEYLPEDATDIMRANINHRGFFFNCMFYQLLCVQHSCSSTQSWGSLLPSIVETRDQNFRDCPLLFSNGNRDFFFVHRGQKSYTPTAFGK